MSGSTISGTITDQTVTLGSAGYPSPLTITATGDIVYDGSAGVGIAILSASTLSGLDVLNDGTIKAPIAIELFNGTVSNSSYIGGEISLGSGFVDNSGVLFGGRYGTFGPAFNNSYGVLLTSEGTVLNSGTIKAGHGTGVKLSGGGTVINSGNISSQYGKGVELTGGGSLNNTGFISGSRNSSGAFVIGGTITNSGGIGGGVGSSGLTILDGVLYNAKGITGGAVAVGLFQYGGFTDNTGGIFGGVGSDDFAAHTGGVGLVLTGGGTLLNQGGIIGSTGSEYASGSGVGGAGATVVAGSTLINQALILGGNDGTDTVYSLPNLGGAGVSVSGALLVNAGTIIGGVGGSGYSTVTGVGVGIYAGLQGVVTNTGLVMGGHAVTGFLAFEHNVDPGATLDITGGIGVLIDGGTVTTSGTIEGGANAAINGVSQPGYGAAIEFNGAGTLVDDPGAVFIGSLAGFATSDVIILPSFTETGFSYVSGTGLELDTAGSALTLDLTGSFSTGDFKVTDEANATTITLLCYLAGTRITTPAGDVPVENLAIGDAVITRFGGYRRIKWIGRQSYNRRFVQANREQIPVRIAAGALGRGLPKRDLFISPGHSMLIEDTLVLAKALVNGVSITQDQAPEELHYHQLEFETHDCVLAEGAWSESFADTPDLRARFHNAAAFWALYPNYVTPQIQQLCAPRPSQGPALERALATLTARATATVTPGALRGWVDAAGPTIEGWAIEGWAQDSRHPELPVALEVLVVGRVIGTVLACGYRADLAAAGIGLGWCQFLFTPPTPIPARLRHALQVRRASDHATLPMTPGLRDRLGVKSMRRRVAA